MIATDEVTFLFLFFSGNALELESQASTDVTEI